ncbi:hypothetical protein [Desulfurobacterium indicum]|uniref:hypothetical protein n=1 Tax=Desulfurobacterium indicum TaxID=1914305 RepID=UPI00098E945B|nr:hypothetical protein [Desulfurobacterium indicum]
METFLPQIDLYARFLKVVRVALHPSDAENEEKIRYIRKGIRDLKRLGKESFINEILNGEKS